ncbi:unnamed protein product [Mesocestoides corti]|uniref:NADH dehydrogenase [ubiquinone] 1 beta subcomplex subunit 11, mitochondrial n=1 Tax=Mesocestoides corti TaxID=53468 RepID=A0A0R3UM44_MESCO|nr:unnamed protein product [Mesocestoides corti]
MYPRLFLPLVVRRVGVFRLNLSSPQLRTFNTSLPAFSSGPSFKNILQKNDLPDDVKKGIESEARDMLKDWLPYGWNDYDRIDDTTKYKTVTFLLMVCFTFGLAFQLWYRPRGLEGDWARREAFLELERRRALGLPLVDPNLIPPERVKLPPKEDLDPDFKIII